METKEERKNNHVLFFFLSFPNSFGENCNNVPLCIMPFFCVYPTLQCQRTSIVLVVSHQRTQSSSELSRHVSSLCFRSSPCQAHVSPEGEPTWGGHTLLHYNTVVILKSGCTEGMYDGRV